MINQIKFDCTSAESGPYLGELLSFIILTLDCFPKFSSKEQTI